MSVWRGALVLGGAAVGVLAFAGPASAHVTVNPSTAVQGQFTRVAFRVPTESDTASTTKLEVHLPENAPVASASTMPVPGWTVSVQRRTLAQPIEVHGAPVTEVVSVITWTAAAGGGIAPGQFQEFPVSLGPLPTVDTMVFKALQTYSDGTIVRWIEEPPANGTEPEHPAPVLRLAPAATPTPTSSLTAGAPAPTEPSGLLIALALAGLVAGLVGAVLGGLAYTRTRRSLPPRPLPPR